MVSRGVAQLVARLLWEQEVRGSSPRTPTPTRLIYQPTNSPILIHIASGSNSVVEFLPSKQAVAGSSPVSRSFVYIVSLQAGEKPSGDNQAAIRQARRRCFYVSKRVQRHPASF